MTGLLQRDPALRLAPLWLFVSALIASAIEGVRLNAMVRATRAGASIDPGAQLAMVLLALWLPVALSLLFLANTPRCTRLDLTLPVPAKRLWTTHVIGAFAASFLVLLGCAAVVALRGWGLGLGLLLRERGLPTVDVGAVLAPVAGTLFLTVVVLQSFHPGRRRLPQSLVFRAGSVGIVILGYPLILLLAKGAPTLALLPFAVGGALLVLTRRAVPATFALIPRAPIPRAAMERRPTSAVVPWTKGSPAGTLAIVARILISGIAPGQLVQLPLSWMGAPFIFVWGMLVAGFPLGLEVRWSFAVLAAYILIAFWPAPMSQLALLDPLPISRTALFAMLTLPGFALLASGFLLGRLLLVLRGADERLLPPSTPILLAGVVLLFLLLASIYMRTFRASLSDDRRKAVYFGILAALVLIQIATVLLAVSGVFDPFEASVALEASLDRLAARHVAVTLACWIGSAALLFAGYGLAEREFQRIEIPLARTTREI